MLAVVDRRGLGGIVGAGDIVERRLAEMIAVSAALRRCGHAAPARGVDDDRAGAARVFGCGQKRERAPRHGLATSDDRRRVPDDTLVPRTPDLHHLLQTWQFMPEMLQVIGLPGLACQRR